jgi:type IV secretory pathway TrbL component
LSFLNFLAFIDAAKAFYKVYPMNPTPTTTTVVNDIFKDSLHAIVDNVHIVQATSQNLLIGLATIEFLMFLYLSYGNGPEEVMKRAVEKLLMIFMVALIAYNWGAVAGGMKGYIAGGAAGAGGGNSMMTSMNPGYIAMDGLDKVSTIFSPAGQKSLMEGKFFKDAERDKRQQDRMGGEKKTGAAAAAGAAAGVDERSGAERAFDKALDTAAPGVSALLNSETSLWEGFTDATTQLGTMIIVGLVFCGLGLLIIFVHFYVALQLFVLTIDWYITVYITGLLVPFAVNKHTSPLASAALQAVVRKSVQLAVTMMVVSMFGRSIQGLALGPQPTMIDVLSLLLGSLTMAMLVKNIPQIAGSIFTGGGGSIDVGGVMQAAASNVAGRVAAAVHPPLPDHGDGDEGDDDSGDGGGGPDDKAGFGMRAVGAALGGASAVAQGGLAVGQKGFELAKQGVESLKGEGPGARDAAPKSMSELHEMKLKDSSQVNNQIEQKALGAMSVDASGNLGEGQPSSHSDAQTSHATPQPQEQELGEGSESSPVTHEDTKQSAHTPQGTHASSNEDAQSSSRGGDWDNVPDTSPDAKNPKK